MLRNAFAQRCTVKEGKTSERKRLRGPFGFGGECPALRTSHNPSFSPPPKPLRPRTFPVLLIPDGKPLPNIEIEGHTYTWVEPTIKKNGLIYKLVTPVIQIGEHTYKLDDRSDDE
ncbi:hypothetical protein M0802_011347 [Mischocyttarus mexicanus]|nr:hypothetical protein M0802_011347 [Mischocyttarus mexicanus]